MLYSLLPFRFERVNDNEVFLSGEAGEFIFLSKKDFAKMLAYKLSTKSKLFLDLKAKHILTDTQIEPIIEMLATKYRTKKSFLNNFTTLHMVVPTLYCNSSCIYCQVTSKEASADGYMMDKSTAKKIVNVIFQSPSPAIKIEFQGGEPLINFDIVKYIVRYAEKLNRFYKKTLQFVLCTNLTLLTSRHLRFFKEYGVLISTTLDGPRDVHDKNRPLRNGESSYDGVIKNLDMAKSELGNDHISALMTITLNNLYMLEEVIDEYLRQGFSSIFLRMLNPYGLARKNKLIDDYTVEEFVAAYINALDYIIALNISGTYFVEEFSLMLLEKILTPFPARFVDFQSPSGAAINAAIYNYDGNVYVSDEARMLAEMGDVKFLMGNVHKNTYNELFNNDFVRDLVACSIIETLPVCSSCAFNPYCSIDPVRDYTEQGNTFGNRIVSESCIKNKMILSHLFSLIKQNDSKIMDVFWSWITKRPLSKVAIGNSQ